jgi:hypothetical protein
MNCSQFSSLLLLVLFSMAQAQQRTPERSQPPTKPKTPTVNCSGAEASKACSSFKQLLEAHDKDILDSLSSPTSYVCFRPNEDAFVIFHEDAPGPYRWQKLDEGAGERQLGVPVLAEFRNGVVYRITPGFGSWFRSSPDAEPLFKSRSDEQFNDGATILIDDTEISISHPFKNQNGETTQYSLTIRRSTGRSLETFASGNTPIATYSGTCLIYR